MGVTQLKSGQFKDNDIGRSDLNVSDVGKAVLRKVIAGTNVELTWTGADPGTGDVTVNFTGGGGGSGPNPTDAFRLKINFGDTNPALSDATSFAFGFPDTIAAMADAISVALTFADTNPSLSDNLLNLAIGIADTIAAQSETIALRVAFGDTNAAPSDAAKIAFTLTDTNTSLADNLLRLAITIAETNTAPTDAATFLVNLAQAETIPTNSDALTRLSVAGYNDSNVAATDARTTQANFWLSGSAGTGVATPANADSVNNGTNAVVSTAVLGPTTETLTSNVGNGIPNGITFGAATYRGWFQYTETLGTSSGSVNAVYSGGTVVMLAITANTDHSSGSFTFDLVAAGINTLAKLQSMTVTHSTTDASAGVTPAVLNVDAGRIELTNVI